MAARRNQWGEVESPAPGVGFYDVDEAGRRGARSGRWHPMEWWLSLWNVRDNCGSFHEEPDPATCQNNNAGRNLFGELVSRRRGGRRKADDQPAELTREQRENRQRVEYDAYLESLYLAAEEATRGQLVKRQHREGPKAVDPRDFFWRRGRAPMYAASEELLTYWDNEKTRGTRKPLTFAQWQAQGAEEAPDVTDPRQRRRRARTQFRHPLEWAA